MTAWQIDPDGVLLALTNTETARGDLSDAATPLVAALDDLFAACPGFAASVPAALVSIVEQQLQELGSVLTRVDGAVFGASRAAGYYLTADTDMATNFQSAAILAASTGDVSKLQELTGG